MKKKTPCRRSTIPQPQPWVGWHGIAHYAGLQSIFFPCHTAHILRWCPEFSFSIQKSNNCRTDALKSVVVMKAGKAAIRRLCFMSVKVDTSGSTAFEPMSLLPVLQTGETNGSQNRGIKYWVEYDGNYYKGKEMQLQRRLKQCATAAVDGDSLGFLWHLDYFFFFQQSYVRENMWSNTFRVSEEMWDPKAAEITSFYQTVQM